MKYTLKISLFCALLFVSAASVCAQEKILVRGHVYSAMDKLPAVGATIMEMNTDNRVVSSTVTNLDGNFSLFVMSKKHSLVVSYVGYKKQTILIGDNLNMKIALQEGTHLQEITVVGKKNQAVGNLDINERDISMAIGKLTAEEIGDIQVASIDEAMQGRIAGVDIMANAGDPGSGMSIRIRGITSISGNNQPLIVVDGIPLETDVANDFDFSTASEEDFSQLLNIAPNDIEEIVVLKDAAANAIWGSRAANGVLQISTKRGSVSPPKVTLRTTASYKPLPPSIPTLSGKEYTTMILEANANAGTILDPLLYPELAYDLNNPVYYYNYSQNTDWVDAVSQDVYTQQYDLSVRGGTSKLRYSISAGYYHDIGNTLGTSMDRINTRTNLDYTVSDKLSFKADMSFTHGVTEKNYNTNVRGHAYSKMPNQSIYYINEYGITTPNFFMPVDNRQGSFPSVFNPIAMAMYGKYTTTSDVILPRLSLAYRPTSTLRYTFDVSFQTNNQKVKKFLPKSASGLIWTDSRVNNASDADSESFSIQTFNKLYYTPNSGIFEDEYKHRLITLLGVSTGDSQGYSFSSASTNLPNEAFQDPSILSKVYPNGSASSGASRNRSLTGFLNANYTLLDKYVAYANLTLNGSSRFGETYRYGLFPSFSTRYRLSGESFMEKLTWLDDLSLRASWGMSGKAPERNYMFYNNYSTYDWTYGEMAATYPSNIELRELRWEKSIQTNYGLNFIAFDNKLNLEAEYYTRTVRDQWSDEASIPLTSGYSEMGLNYGVVQNRGWEVSVNFSPVTTKDLRVNLAFNVSRSENVIKEISQYASMESGSWSNRGQYLSRVVIGKPTGSFFGYLYDGVYLNKDQTIAMDEMGNQIFTVDEQGNQQPVYMRFGYPSINYQFQPGDARYVDVNHDGNINYQDIVWLGDKNPLFTGGFTPSIKWKQWSLNTVFFFRYGNYIKNTARMNLERMYSYENQSTAVLKRWTHPYENPEDAPKDILPRALYGTGYNWLGSSRYVEDGSFIRWKSLTLRYNVERDLIRRFKMDDLYLYFTVNNLHVWTNYTGQDPEVSLGSGEDGSRTPVPRQFTLGLNVSF